MVLGNVHPRIRLTMFVQGHRSAMFLWQYSSNVMAMFLRLDAFLTSLCRKQGSADGTAALTANLGSLEANMSLRGKEWSANGTTALTTRL